MHNLNYNVISILSKIQVEQAAQPQPQPVPTPIVAPNATPNAGEANVYEGVGRNDPCPCGSGLRFKHCHGNRAQQTTPLTPPPAGLV